MVHPTMTRNIVLPSIVDDYPPATYYNTSTNQPQNQPSQMAFYVLSLKLILILGEILESFYSGGPVQLPNMDDEFEEPLVWPQKD